jgi:2,3-bisphosphoglycerate-dependent phosphoglycerate mutase
MPNLILIRHGLSIFNEENRFTGWLDVPLSNNGIQEAKKAAKSLLNYKIDIAYTSELKRAIQTLQIILDEREGEIIPVFKNRALNERHYGTLQGLNKAEVEKLYGKEQVLSWRRGYNDTPPGGESLKDTASRVIPFFKSTIYKDIQRGLNILVVAHGNSLRAIFKELDQISDEEIVNLNIDTAKPYVYQFDEHFKILFRIC